MVTLAVVIVFWVIAIGGFLALVWWADKPRRDLLKRIKARSTMTVTVYPPRVSRWMRKAEHDG